MWRAGPGAFSFERLLAFCLVELLFNKLLCCLCCLCNKLARPCGIPSTQLCIFRTPAQRSCGPAGARQLGRIYLMWAAPAALVVGAVGVWRAVSQRRAVPPQTPAQQEKAAGEELLAEEGGCLRTIRRHEFGKMKAAALQAELHSANQPLADIQTMIQCGRSASSRGAVGASTAASASVAGPAAESEVEARKALLQLPVTKRSATALVLRREHGRKWEKMSWTERWQSVQNIDTSRYEQEEDAWRRLVAMPSEVRAAAAAKHYNEWASMSWVDKLAATEAVARDVSYSRQCRKTLRRIFCCPCRCFFLDHDATDSGNAPAQPRTRTQAEYSPQGDLRMF